MMMLEKEKLQLAEFETIIIVLRRIISSIY